MSVGGGKTQSPPAGCGQMTVGCGGTYTGLQISTGHCVGGSGAVGIITGYAGLMGVGM